jgi:hypothetical protein
MKQVFRLFGRFLLFRPLGLVLLLCVYALASAQAIILSEAFFSLERTSVVPRSVRTVMVFVKGPGTQDELAVVKKSLLGVRGVENVEAVSRKAGFEKLKEWLGKESPVVSGMDGSDLPDAFSVVVSEQHLASAGNVAGEIWKMPQVADVRYSRGLAENAARLAASGRLLARYVLMAYAASLCLLIFCVVRLRLVKRDSWESGRLAMNLAVFLEGVFYVLVSLLLGRYIGGLAAGYACTFLPELSSVLLSADVRPALAGMCLSALPGIAGTILSLKVGE